MIRPRLRSRKRSGSRADATRTAAAAVNSWATSCPPCNDAAMAAPHLIYETVHGSRAYGLDREGSDTDVKGVVIGPAAWYAGFRGGPEQVDLSPDHVRYDIRKLFRLAAAGNPTVLEVLWTDPADHVVVTDLGRRLLEHRNAFLSKRIAERFSAYARGQLRRIETHRSWLRDPPAIAPTRAAFALPEHTGLPADQLAAAARHLDTNDPAAADLSATVLDVLHRERRYKAAQDRWTQFRSWERGRNPARAALERAHGYDTKHAMHLIRLQRTAVEVLQTGELTIRRADRDDLLAIRDGALAYPELLEMSELLHAQTEAAATTSSLPDDPDDDALDELCTELVLARLGGAS